MPDYNFKAAQWLRRCAFTDGKNLAAKKQLDADTRRVIAYCLNNTYCRRTQVLSYFSEEFSGDKCNDKCDNCRDKTPIRLEDVREEAYDLIRCAEEITSSGQTTTRIMFLDMYMGRSTESTRSKGLDQLGTFGIRRGIDRGRAERIFDELTGKEVFEAHFVANSNQHKRQLTEYFRVRVVHRAARLLSRG